MIGSDSASGAASSPGLHQRIRRRDYRFRPDIEGLRAVAVLGVVLFHAGLGSLSGGFAGVDVFYVISGFLITDHLWREVGRSGGLSFAAFYARRARRLLPAAMLVLVVTMGVAAAVLPPLEVRSVWKDGLYCAVYLGNFRFAATQTNYLADPTPSPFQHFWSLGVEEQFYLVWPILLFAASLAWRRKSASRASAVATLGAVCVISLILSVVLTKSDQPVAFFLLPSRAWELGLGGLIALGAPELRRIPFPVNDLIGWSGLAAVIASFVVFGAHTAYPGSAALLPVVGAGAIIVAGLSRPVQGVSTLLGAGLMRAMGRISYSWYLWHYPVLILAPYALHRPGLSRAGNLLLVAASAGLAALTYRYVEDPARRARWVARPSRGLVAGLSLSTAGVLACVGAASTIPSLQGHGLAAVPAIHFEHGRPGLTAPRLGSSRLAPIPPALAAVLSAQQQVESAVVSSARTAAVPANLNPSLSNAAASEAPTLVDGCLDSYTSSSVQGCQFGDTTSDKSVILFGDSHAGMWFPAIDAFANAHGYRLDVRTKAACPPVQITIFSPVPGRTWSECSAWYSNVMAQIAATRPALVVLGIAPNYDAAYDVVQNGPPWLAGLAHTVDTIRSDGGKVLVLGSAPGPTTVVPDCLSANLDNVTACDFSPIGHRVGGGGLVGIDQPGDQAEARTVNTHGGIYADVDPWFCTPWRCDTVVGNLLVYRDISHITVPYADYLAPLVGDEMSLTLSRP